MMQVLFETRDPQAENLRELAVRRARFVMRRLSWLVPQATVRMADVNGPRGGVDKRCSVELSGANVGRVVIVAMAADWRTALEQALSRAAHALRRDWQRRRGMRHAERRAMAGIGA